MEPVERQLTIRDRYRRKLMARLTPAERIARWEKLQQAWFAELHRSPDGYRHFLQRNYRKRAVAITENGPATIH